jgi:hypothetical protein
MKEANKGKTSSGQLQTAHYVYEHNGHISKIMWAYFIVFIN